MKLLESIGKLPKMIFIFLFIVFLMGLVIAEDNETFVEEGEIYSEGAYGMYYIIIIGVILTIIFVFLVLMMPRIKSYT